MKNISLDLSSLLDGIKVQSIINQINQMEATVHTHNQHATSHHMTDKNISAYPPRAVWKILSRKNDLHRDLFWRKIRPKDQHNFGISQINSRGALTVPINQLCNDVIGGNTSENSDQSHEKSVLNQAYKCWVYEQSPTLTRSGEDHGHIRMDKYLHWYEAFWGKDQKTNP